MIILKTRTVYISSFKLFRKQLPIFLIILQTPTDYRKMSIEI